MFGNTASSVAAGGAQAYRLDGGYFEKIKIKASSTATVAAGAITVCFHGIHF